MKITRGIQTITATLVLTAALAASGCAPTIPPAASVVAPTPIADNSGKVYSPFTSDGTVAKWVDKGIAARFGSAVGSTAGQIAGQQAGKAALSAVPFAGGILGGIAGDKIGSEVGRKIAIEASGGWEFIKSTSDLSFGSERDMVIYIYARHSAHKDYAKVVDLVGEIYPDVKSNYTSWLATAPVK